MRLMFKFLPTLLLAMVSLSCGSDNKGSVVAPVASESKFISIANGGDFSLGLTADGKVYSWGYNLLGQLGLGDTTDRSIPIQVAGFDNKTITSIYAGSKVSFAIAEDTTVYAWGSNFDGNLGVGNVVIDNCYEVNCATTPQHIVELDGKSIKSISAGNTRFLALADNGTVYSWGRNFYDQADVIVYKPEQITALDGKVIIAISTGNNHSLALQDDRTVYAWGSNSYGQVGLGDRNIVAVTPTQIVALNGKNIKAISAGDKHSLAIADNGTVYSWGNNKSGQLGLGFDTIDDCLGNACAMAPKHIVALDNKSITAISAGYEGSLALSDNGTVYSWGDNFFGELGIGADITTDSCRDVNGLIFSCAKSPIQVTTLDGKGVTSIFSGSYLAFVIAPTAKVYSWGYNQFGQLGLGDNLNRDIPTQLPER